MFKCHICGELTARGKYNYQDRFTCVDCEPMTDFLHYEEFEIGDDGIIRCDPMTLLTESEQRWILINLIYKIYNNKINQSVFTAIPRYLKKGYTYLGIVRALEYHYVVKKGSIAKGNNGIGIVPYVYDEAQTYFKSVNARRYLQYLQFYQQQQQDIQTTVTEVAIDETKRTPQIDIESL